MKHTITLEDGELEGRGYWKAIVRTELPEGMAAAQVRSEFFSDKTEKWVQYANILHKVSIYLGRGEFTVMKLDLYPEPA